MGIEGRLTIDLDRAADGTGRASISSSRPLALTKAFVGRSAHETVQTLPILFNVCGMAQGAAAAQACERALGIRRSDETGAVRDLLVLAETLREHLIRAVFDWARFLGLEAKKPDVARIMRVSEGLRRALDPERQALSIGGRARLDATRLVREIGDVESLIEELVLGEPIEAWRTRRSAGDLESWSRMAMTPAQKIIGVVLDRGWAEAGQANTRFLPPLADGALFGRLLDGEADAFVRAPTWNGAAHETSALARQAENPLVRDLMGAHGSGLLTRLAARLVEIAEAPRAMGRILEDHREDSAKEDSAGGSVGASGRGVAQVEAARGRLIHGVEIADNVVRRYAIVAPTEWNFHAEGSAALGLADIAGRADGVREIAELFVTAVDPCVGYELRVA